MLWRGRFSALPGGQAPAMGEDRKTIQKKAEIEYLIVFNEKSQYEPADGLSMTMENQILLDKRSVIDSGLVTEVFSQNSPVSSENFNLETAVINNPTEDGLLSSQDNQFCTVKVGETLLDHFKYPLTISNQNTVVKVEVYPHGNNSCEDENYKELNIPEAAHTHSPYLPPNGVHILSSLAMQHKNCSVPTSSIFSPEGTVNQNVRMIPVFRSFIPPVAVESSSDICGLPQAGASVYDEIAEARDAVSDVTENHQDRAIFQSSNVDESGCKLLTWHSVSEESGCSHRHKSNPVVIGQVEGGPQILCINSCGTQELNPIHLIPEYHDQHHYLQADVGNHVRAVLGQFLSVPCELVLNEQEIIFKYEAETTLLQKVRESFAVAQPLPGCMTEGRPVPSSDSWWIAGDHSLPFGAGVTKSEKPCNCTKSQCLKLYCDCFANGDFCKNCNCTNCYNNQLHETERLKAIKACLERNPEAFLPNIGKRKLGEIKHHHNKGCNCKRSGCLKNYCECFEAKIVCSSICKCIGCKNYEESPDADEKKWLNMINYMDIGNKEGNSPVLTSAFNMLPKLRKDRQPAVYMSWKEVKPICACLLL